LWKGQVAVKNLFSDFALPASAYRAGFFDVPVLIFPVRQYPIDEHLEGMSALRAQDIHFLFVVGSFHDSISYPG
jgi:hypothetical protein